MEIPPGLTDILHAAGRVVVLTGSGVSAESGVPTFRDAQTGLWSHYRPEELATPQAFQENPGLVWDWYTWRRSLILAATPNAGHIALARLESWLDQKGTKFTLITQNVDGLHQRAGSKGMIELHGSILRSKCSSEGTLYDFWPESRGEPPPCPACGAYLRPDVVWFGETLPGAALKSAWAATLDCDLFFSIGTSSLVEPAASLPVVAVNGGASLVEINPTSTPLTSLAHITWKAPAGIAIPALYQAVAGD